MTPYDADIVRALFQPETVALVGASDDAAKLTARPMRFLRAGGFGGRIVPVNPTRETVLGERAYPSVGDVPGRVDHAYVLVSTDRVIDAVRDCAAAGVPVVSVLADGFAEAGPEGKARQAALEEIARSAGMLLIGPNSMGVVDTGAGFLCTTNAAFQDDAIRPGRTAVLSQSGSIIGTLLSRGAERGVAFSRFVSLGNEAVAGAGRLGLSLVDDPGIDAFALFLETIRDPEELAAFGRRAAEAGKPVVAYMLGRSAEGQALAVSHTGALTGSREAVAAFLDAHGIRRAEQFDSFLEAPDALARTRLPPDRPRTVTVVSTTGGGGAMMIDQLSLRGVSVAGCSAAARRELEAEGIPLGHGKLVDVTLAGTRYDVMKAVVSRLMADPKTGLLIVAIGSSARRNPELAVKPLVDAVAEAAEGAAPVVAVPLPHAPESLAMLREGGVTCFGSVDAAAEVVAMMTQPVTVSEGAAWDLPQDAARTFDNQLDLAREAATVTLDERGAGAVFSAAGVPFPAQRDVPAGGSIAAADGLRFPVVAKVVSPDLPHKTEAGAVALDIPDAGALAKALTRIAAAAQAHRPGYRDGGFLVQEMRSGLGEALIGMTRDPLVGPVLTIGAGGTLAEIYRDAVTAPLPVSIEAARDIIARIRGFAPLRGYRGAPRGDLEALAQLAVAASQLMSDPRIEEAELNPVLIGPEGEGCVALDALIRVSDVSHAETRAAS